MYVLGVSQVVVLVTVVVVMVMVVLVVVVAVVLVVVHHGQGYNIGKQLLRLVHAMSCEAPHCETAMPESM